MEEGSIDVDAVIVSLVLVNVHSYIIQCEIMVTSIVSSYSVVSIGFVIFPLDALINRWLITLYILKCNTFTLQITGAKWATFCVSPGLHLHVLQSYSWGQKSIICIYQYSHYSWLGFDHKNYPHGKCFAILQVEKH